MARKKKSLKDEIKEMEQKKREEAVPQKATEKEVSFDSWYHQRKSKIKKCHMKEIIWADFVSRGMGKRAKMDEYDKALGLYGVKLK
jgi:hypothetical protein